MVYRLVITGSWLIILSPGIEGGLSLSDIEDENGGNLEGNNEWYGNSEIKNTANLNLKIGYAFYNWLPYVTTGLTVASMDYMSGCQSNGQSMGSDCETPFESSADDFRVGYNVGAGYNINLWIVSLRQLSTLTQI